jgi:hypothetical protein
MVLVSSVLRLLTVQVRAYYVPAGAILVGVVVLLSDVDSMATVLATSCFQLSCIPARFMLRRVGSGRA